MLSTSEETKNFSEPDVSAPRYPGENYSGEGGEGVPRDGKTLHFHADAVYIHRVSAVNTGLHMQMVKSRVCRVLYAPALLLSRIKSTLVPSGALNSTLI